MHFLHRRPLSRHRPFIRTLYEAAISIQRPRDRGLDHAVAREAHLQPLLNIKNHIINTNNSSKTIPYSQIIDSKKSLQIPYRPLDLIRSYPSIFQEVYPGSVVDTQPDIKLTDDVVNLSLQEDLLYSSVDFKQEVAVRLLKLLMINRVNKIPISLLDVLKWDLGLPNDYENGLIPEFPDYFRVVENRSGDKELELVFWSDEFAVSEMDKRGEKRFSLNYSTGFEMDKGYKKWLDEWAELPYVSPYENATRLPVKSDESDRWAVGVLHEVLNLFVGRKAEREKVMCLGDYLGIRSRFKLAFLHHPGIFYTSTKIGTQTVVLRDAYKRGAMVKRHALMDLRFKYVQLMNTMVEEEKTKKVLEKSGVEEEGKGGVEEYGDSDSGEEDDVEMCESTDEDEDEGDSEEEEESEDESQRGRHRRNLDNYEENNSTRSGERRPSGRNTHKKEYESSERVHGRTNARSAGYAPSKGRGDNYEDNNSRRNGERRPSGRNTHKNEFESSERVHGRTNARSAGYAPSNGRGDNFEEKDSRRSMESRSRGRSTPKNDYESSRGSSRRSSDNSDRFVPRRSRQTSDGYEEGEDKGGFKRREFKREINFDDKNVRSKPRRSYGRDTLSNENEGSTRFPRRMNVRDYVKKQSKV